MNHEKLAQSNLSDYVNAWRIGISKTCPEPRLNEVIFYMNGYYRCVWANGQDSRWSPIIEAPLPSHSRTQ